MRRGGDRAALRRQAPDNGGGARLAPELAARNHEGLEVWDALIVGITGNNGEIALDGGRGNRSLSS